MEGSLAETFRAHFRVTLKLLCHFAPWEQIKTWVCEQQHELDAAPMAPAPLKSSPRARRPPRIPELAAPVQSYGNRGHGEGKGGKPLWQQHKRRGGRNRGKGGDHRKSHGVSIVAAGQRVPLFDVART